MLTPDQSPLFVTSPRPSLCVLQPAKIDAADSSCPSAKLGLRTVNEVIEGPYGFVWVCTQASHCACAHVGV